MKSRSRVRQGKDKIAKDLLKGAVHDFMISPSPLKLEQQSITTEGV
jgi:hypothetical protein